MKYWRIEVCVHYLNSMRWISYYYLWWLIRFLCGRICFFSSKINKNSWFSNWLCNLNFNKWWDLGCILKYWWIFYIDLWSQLNNIYIDHARLRFWIANWVKSSAWHIIHIKIVDCFIHRKVAVRDDDIFKIIIMSHLFAYLCPNNLNP